MPEIKPFKGLRPQKQFAKKVAAPPYDVLNSEEARKLAKDKPYNFLHVSKPEIDLPPELDIYDKKVYAKGKENLKKFIGNGILIQEDKPSFYIYRQIMGDHTQTGIVACASVQDYDNKKIKIHEHTREVKEKDRTKHVDTLNANTGPVFLTYHAQETINNIVENIKEDNAPLFDLTSDDGIKHTIWKLDDTELIEKLQKQFAQLDKLYISDGHHRSASAANVQKIRKQNNPHHTGDEEYNYFLTVIFPDVQMNIMDYNRVVQDLHGLNKDEFLQAVKNVFVTEKQTKQYKPQNKHQFSMYLDGEWYRLTAKTNSFPGADEVKSLDVSILHDNLMEPVLGISNPRKDKRISFVGGIRGLKELEKLVDSGDFKVAFALYPTSIQDLIQVADADKVMPPKSTWFEPKLRSGLITHLI